MAVVVLADRCGTTTGYRRGCRCDECRAAHREQNRSYQISPTRESFRAMRARCSCPTNVKYSLYGGRGIAVCERWDSFENFLADMGERPEGTTLDRIDPDGDYDPGNCRWATPLEQRRNRRRSEA